MTRKLLNAEVLCDIRTDHLNTMIADKINTLLPQDSPEIEPMGITIDETGTSTKAVLFKVYREV